ncbi:MAG: hypothetical protein ABW277_17695 [Longimicrobiaceae bacterium]
MLIKRIATITAGLMGAGAAAGSVVGFGFAMSLLTVKFFEGELPGLVFGVLGTVFLTVAGATAGALLGPVAAWLLMRHVPLGRAVGGAALGALGATVAGAALGIATGTWDHGLLFYPLLGLGASSVYLNVSTPKENRRIGGWAARLLPRL